MLHSAASAAGRRLHPVHVLAVALLLCSLSLLLHGQLQVHSQLRAANTELHQIKDALAALGNAEVNAADIHRRWNSSSSIHHSNLHSSGVLHRLVHIVRQQQNLITSIDSIQGIRNKQLQHRAQQLSEEVSGLLGLAHGNGSAAVQHTRALPAAEAGSAATGITSSNSSSVRCSSQQDTNSTAVPPGTLCLDLTELLGLPQFLSGITWEPKTCFSGLAKIYTNPADQEELKQKLLRDLTRAAATVRNVDIDSINVSLPWWAAINGQPPAQPKSILSDPAFHKWQLKLMGVLSRYMVRVDNKAPAVPCPGAPPAWAGIAVDPADLPMPHCPGRGDAALVQQIGRHGQPFEPLANIANVIMSFGTCTVPDREGFHSYGDFMMARVMNSKWRTFKTNTLAEDAVVFLWDILYQARQVFMKQRWLGVAAMQQPFDFLAIADIIYEVQPDIILETGTANGGSALMWASLLELNGLTNSSVITVDLEKPGAPGAFGADPPAAVMTANGQVVMVPRRRPQQDPVKHFLWSKYVTFVQGSSIDPSTITRVKAMLQQKQHELWQQGASSSEAELSSTGSSSNTSHDRHISEAHRPLRVLVLLDSHHAAAHVLTEMESYCPMVSVGSFCVIEDTKLSRWTNSDAGPLASVQSFLAWHPEFALDRDRELLFTHHPYGYLQRLY